MRLHVTGAGGFIGGHLCAALPKRAHETVTTPNGCDAVVHLANIAHARVPSEELERVNVEGTLARAREAAAAGVRRFLYMSSILAADPNDLYGRSKLAAEGKLADVDGIEVVVLRPPLVYGPRVKANFLYLMHAIARGTPLPFASIDNRRSLVYVGNLVDAIIHCLEAPRVAGKTFPVSDGASLSTPQICRAVGESLGRPARLFSFPPRVLEIWPAMRKLTRSLEVDDSAIRRELGWRPPFTFEEGLRATAQWYRSR